LLVLFFWRHSQLNILPLHPSSSSSSVIQAQQVHGASVCWATKIVSGNIISFFEASWIMSGFEAVRE
jgi:hypothetical protein